MKVKWESVASALFTFLLLVVLPTYAFRVVPPQLLEQIRGAGFDTNALVIQLALIGLVSSAVALVKGITEPTSVAYLIVNLVGSSMYFLFALLFLGFGNVANLGSGSSKFTSGSMDLLLSFDFRVFIWISALAVALQMLQAVYEWREARSEAADAELPSKPV